MEEHVKMSMMELSGAIVGLGTKERTAKQVKLKRLVQNCTCFRRRNERSPCSLRVAVPGYT